MRLIVAVILLTIIYLIQKILFRKFWNKGLDTEVSFSRDYIECGESAELIELIEVVSNDKFLPLPVFHLKFSVDKSLKFLDKTNSNVTDLYHKNELFSILGHQRITRRLSFTGTSRGVVGVNNASILVRDFFMLQSYACKMHHSDVIYVFPKKLNSDRFKVFFRGIMGEIESKRSIVEDNLSFRGVRQYQSFDPYRSINWKQSAKARELMVNMYGYTTDSRVKIMLNLDNDYMIETNKLLEEAISLASSIARDLLADGIMVSVITNGTDRNGNVLPAVEEGAEKRHGVTIDRMLSEISGSEGKDRFLDYLRKEALSPRDNTLYLVISPYARQDLISVLDSIDSAGSSVRLIVPCYDEYPFISDRPYAEGWEVPINV